jgi:mono/diheme cytochrome c family protein
MKKKVNKICNQLLKLSSTGLLLLITGFSAPIQAADFPQAGNFANGSKVWADTCSRCHNMRGPQELRDDQWITTAFHMRIRAGLTGQETRDVITFLQTSNSKMEAEGTTQTLQ